MFISCDEINQSRALQQAWKNNETTLKNNTRKPGLKQLSHGPRHSNANIAYNMMDILLHL